MTTLLIPSNHSKTAKLQPVESEFCAYKPGRVYRTAPMRSLSESTECDDDAEAAMEALSGNVDEDVPYEDFRKDLGL